MSKIFFMVYGDGPTHRPPVHKHACLTDAMHEAERLACLFPGTPFYVLAAMSESRTKNVVTSRLDGFDDLTIPF